MTEILGACRAGAEQVVALVEEGILEPEPGLRSWSFRATAPRCAQAAIRLQRDLDINAEGVVLVEELRVRQGVR